MTMWFCVSFFVQLSFVVWMVNGQSNDTRSGGRDTIECKLPFGNEPDPLEKCSHWFYICDTENVGRPMLCQENLYYDWGTMECDHYTNVPECTGASRGSIGTTTTTARATTIDQSQFDCSRKHDGNYADERGTIISGKRVPNCANRYWTCSNGLLYEKRCQPGYFYDRIKNECGSQDVVFDCNGGINVTLSPTTRRTTVEGIHFDCWNKTSGNYPDPFQLCSHYYFSCSEGAVGSRIPCPAETYYNRETLRCDNYDVVFDCTGVRLSSTVAPSTSTHSWYYFNCTGLVDGRMYPDPIDKCSHTFFQCSNGIGVKESCADSAYFDVHSQRCEEFGSVFDCSGVRRSSTPPTTTTTDVPYFFDCKGIENGKMFPNPDQPCSHIFFECSNGHGWKKECAKASSSVWTYFDVHKQACDYKKNVPACTGTSPSVGDLSTTSKATGPERTSTSVPEVSSPTVEVSTMSKAADLTSTSMPSTSSKMITTEAPLTTRRGGRTRAPASTSDSSPSSTTFMSTTQVHDTTTRRARVRTTMGTETTTVRFSGLK